MTAFKQLMGSNKVFDEKLVYHILLTTLGFCHIGKEIEHLY